MSKSQIAIVRAYGKSRGAVVTVERRGRPPHRYRVSRRRYHALHEWLLFGNHGCETSGAFLRGSFDGPLWQQEPMPVPKNRDLADPALRLDPRR